MTIFPSYFEFSIKFESVLIDIYVQKLSKNQEITFAGRLKFIESSNSGVITCDLYGSVYSLMFQKL